MNQAKYTIFANIIPKDTMSIFIAFFCWPLSILLPKQQKISSLINFCPYCVMQFFLNKRAVAGIYFPGPELKLHMHITMRIKLYSVCPA